MLGGDIINKLQETKIQFFFKRENIFSIIPKGPKMYVSFAKTFFHREKNAKKRKYSKIVFAPFGGGRIFSHFDYPERTENVCFIR